MRTESMGSRMLNAIVRFLNRFRGYRDLARVCAPGLRNLFTLPCALRRFPEFAPPEVSIQTEAPGLSPRTVEVLVTQPIENAINGSWHRVPASQGRFKGFSVIAVVFRSGTDVYRDRQAVTERLSTVAKELPTGVQPSTDDSPHLLHDRVMEVGLTTDKQSLMTLRTIATGSSSPPVGRSRRCWRWRSMEVKSARSIPVRSSAARSIWSERRGSNRRRAKASGVRGLVLWKPQPANRSAKEGQSVPLRSWPESVLVHHNGANVTLGRSARAADAPAPTIGASSIGENGCDLIVVPRTARNTLEVTRGVDQALADLRPPWKQGIRSTRKCFAQPTS